MSTAIAPGVDDFLAPPVARTRTVATPADRVQHDLPAGTEVPLIEPGTDAWFTTISASKIAAITGRSAWDSAYRLFRVMRGQVEPEGIDDVKAAGHYHEPGIAAWFRDQHPDWTVRPCGTFVAATNPRHTAAPDRLVYKPEHPDVADLLEIKTTRKPEQWGQPGTDQIPASYRDQVDWQMHCAGASRTHVAVEFPWFEYAEYVVDYDPERIAALVAAADAFLELLDRGECPPPDGHPKTLEAQQEVYGTVDPDEGHDFDENLVRRYVQAIAARKAAEAEEIGATTVIVETLAGRRHARYAGETFAEWKPWREGLKPKLYARPKLPNFDEIAAPAEEPAPPGAGTEPGVTRPPAPEPAAPATQAPTGSGSATADGHEDGGLATAGECSGSPATVPDGANTEPVHIADVLPDAVLEMRTTWIKARLTAIRDCGDPAGIEAVRRFWPATIAPTGPWTDSDIDAIDQLLHSVEILDAIPFPAGDPAKPTATEELAAARAAQLEAQAAEDAASPLRRPIEDDGILADAATRGDLKIIVGALDATQKALAVDWERSGKTCGRDWRFGTTPTRRIAAINGAAFACALHLDEDTTRLAIEAVTGDTLTPAWPTGAVLGSLTYRQALDLRTYAERVGAGHGDTVTDLGHRIANHAATQAP